jgi:hypothetical protein
MCFEDLSYQYLETERTFVAFEHGKSGENKGVGSASVPNAKWRITISDSAEITF